MPKSSIVALLSLALAACSEGGKPGADAGAPDGGAPAGADAGQAQAFTWDFEDGTSMDFYADQSDFEEATRGGLDVAVEALGAPLSGQGLRVTADNRSDDQWAYIARELGAAEGVVAGQRYQAAIRVKIASHAPSGCVGVGGSYESVFLRAGVVAKRPVPLPADASGYIGFSADKGNQATVGAEAVDLGNIATSGTECTGSNPWVLLERSGTMEATAAADGKLYLYVGTDSGFEAAHSVSYDEVSVTLTPN